MGVREAFVFAASAGETITWGEQMKILGAMYQSLEDGTSVALNYPGGGNDVLVVPADEVSAYLDKGYTQVPKNL